MPPPVPLPLLALRTRLGVTVVCLNRQPATDDNLPWLLGEQLCGLVSEDGCRRLVVDLSNAELVSAATISRLVLLYKKLRQAEGRLALCRLSPPVRELFALCRLDQLFAIYEDEDAAVNALRFEIEPGSSRKIQ